MARTYAMGALVGSLLLGVAPGSARADGQDALPGHAEPGRPLWSCPVPVEARTPATPKQPAPATKPSRGFTESNAPRSDCSTYPQWESMLQAAMGDSSSMGGAPGDHDEEAPICVEGDPQCSPTSPMQPPSSIRFFVAKCALAAWPWALPRRAGSDDIPRVIGGALAGHPTGLFKPPRI